ncbi:hypothetical protein FOCC_FOCC002248 [Frankliniella occidentalis]|nr:hypothetical protein FOCC_FOCC002248 [Frankliniella occidentalis]
MSSPHSHSGSRGDSVPESSTASSSSRRRPREQTPASSRATTSTSTTPNSNSDPDPEVAGLTQDGKDKDQAKCNLCAVTGISTPTGATTLLQCHLKVHLQQYSEYNKLQNIKKKIALKKAQGRSRDVSDKRVIQFPLDSNDKKAKQITNVIALFMAKGLKPESVVEELGFQHLIYILEPRYVIPSGSQFSRHVIPNLYISEKKKLQIRLQELRESNDLKSISLTIDAWTSRKMDSFLAFTLQFINLHHIHLVSILSLKKSGSFARVSSKQECTSTLKTSSPTTCPINP